MSKVYIVMDYVFRNGDIEGPYIEEVFSSKKKAVEYINHIWSDVIFTYIPDTQEYYRNVSEHTKAFKRIVEREVQ